MHTFGCKDGCLDHDYVDLAAGRLPQAFSYQKRKLHSDIDIHGKHSYLYQQKFKKTVNVNPMQSRTLSSQTMQQPFSSTDAAQRVENLHLYNYRA